MSGIALKDLTKYHQRAMQYFKNGLVSEQNRLYAQTEEAGAVSFWPLGGTPLEGKVKFSFKETPPASGDKGPENPSTIAGVSTVKVYKSGLNICDPANVSIRNLQRDSDNWYYGTVDNTNGSSAIYAFTYIRFTVPIFDSDQYCLVAETQNSDQVFFGTLSESAGQHPKLYGSPSSLVLSGTSKGKLDLTVKTTGNPDILLRITTRVDAGSSKNLKYRCAILKCLASEVDLNNYKYEPCEYVTDTVSLNDTYYGGEIDLATGVMTVTWGGKIFDGTERWNIASDSTDDVLNAFSDANLPTQEMNNTQNATTRFCTHFPYKQPLAVNTVFTWGASTRVYFRLPKSNFTSGMDVSNWLASEYNAGHPVILAYLLYAPKTVQLTPLQLTALAQKDKYTPRMNTVYTDADSIQIRYRKSLIHDEDEKVQAIVALGGNV